MSVGIFLMTGIDRTLSAMDGSTFGQVVQDCIKKKVLERKHGSLFQFLGPGPCLEPIFLASHIGGL